MEYSDHSILFRVLVACFNNLDHCCYCTNNKTDNAKQYDQNVLYKLPAVPAEALRNGPECDDF